MCDQLRADQLGCYGNQVVRTPNVDSLAHKSTRFKEFYVNNPLCQPNRATLMSGQMPSVNGVRQNGIPLSMQSVTYADVLRGQGYQTGYFGKAHLQNVTSIPAVQRSTLGMGEEPVEQLIRKDQREGLSYSVEARGGWLEGRVPDVELPYYGFEKLGLCIGHGDQVAGHYSHWLNQKLHQSETFKGPENSLDPEVAKWPQCWHTAIPEALYPSSYVTNEVKNFVVNRDKTKSFCVVASYPDPHHPFTPPGKYAQMYQPSEMPLPISFGKPISTRDDLPTSILEAYNKGDANPNQYWPFHIKEEHLQQVLALCYGAISNIDDQVGELLKMLNEEGLDGNTQIVFMSDHGDYMGDFGTLLKSGVHSRGVLQVPLIWFDPKEKASVCDRQISAIDFAPSLLQRLGVKVPIGMQGQDAYGSDFEALPVLIEDEGLEVYSNPDKPTAQLSIIYGEWRLSILDNGDWGEMYNLEIDPYEVNNLWNNQDYFAIKLDLLMALSQRQLALRDRSLVATAQA